MSVAALALFALCLGCSSSARGVSGHVYMLVSNGGELAKVPLAHASVWLGGAEQYTGRTDATGHFQLPAAAPGSPFTLRAVATGYPITSSLPIPAGETEADLLLVSFDLLTRVGVAGLPDGVFTGAPALHAPDFVNHGLFFAWVNDVDLAYPLGGARVGVVGGDRYAVVYGRGAKTNGPPGGTALLDHLDGEKTVALYHRDYDLPRFTVDFEPGVVVTAQVDAHLRPVSTPPTVPGIAFTEEGRARGVTAVHATDFTWQTSWPGVLARDLDGDGSVDLLFTNTPSGAHQLYLNDGTGHFALQSNTGLFAPTTGSGLCSADLDNDGLADLYLVSSAPASNRGGLYKNLGGGKFALQGSQAPGPESEGTSCAFADFDNDGLVDLAVAGAAYDSRQLSANVVVLYRNLGGFRFSEVGRVGFDSVPRSTGLAFADLDRDGLPDLLVANQFGPLRAYRNVSGGGLVAFAPAPSWIGSAPRPGDSWNGLALGDFDGDGAEDLFGANISDLRAPFSGPLPQLHRNLLARWNTTTPGFQPFAGAADALDTGWSWSSAFTDVDNDGRQDLYVVGNLFSSVYGFINGSYVTVTQPDFGLPVNGGVDGRHSSLLHNTAGGFVDVTAGAGIDDPNDARGLAVADLDGDGFPDLVVSHVWDRPSIWMGHPNGNAWLKVKAVGTQSNRDAIGARIEVTAGGSTQVRVVRAGEGYMSQSDPRALFGLGQATSVDQVRVVFPSGQQVTLGPVTPDQELTVTEP